MEALRVISEDHRNLWRIAATIDIVADEMESGSKVDPAFFTSIFDYIEHFMDACHHAKEDDYLFPALRARSEEAGAILDRLQAEHRNGPEILKSLRQQLAETAAGKLGNAEFAGALRTYTQSLKSHIRTEEKDAMPLAREVLTADDWADIDRAFLDSDDPMFGEKANAEFRELFHRVASLAPESIGLGAQSAGELQPGAAKGVGEVLLSVSGLESCYGRIKALKGIDFEVRRGETVALVGANGAGKTTLLRTLSGVQPMSAGSIRPKGQVAEDMEKVFSMFPILKEKRNLPAGTLSGGQQQMLAIGRALMGRPKLLLLDEPSMGLAPLLVQEVFNVVRTLKAQGMTIILAEQNAFAALAIADRGYVLETGSITLSGTGQELISNEQVRAAYLGM
ncbi:MAG: amino acid/amide transporter ATP-binding protein 2, family [Proteobacteria bacterium]|nr:amino acid/amide transporter ATP-binding protein 2, family [Pseudomonadota bacterium]